MAKSEMEVQTQGQPSNSKRNPRAAAKVCEFMTYTGREAFKRLRTNVLLAFPEETDACRVIGVTSAQVSEGKSTVSVNLAYSLAELGKKVLLIDGDMRRPSIHEKLGITSISGLSEAILGVEEVGKTVNTYISGADTIRFNFMTSGEIPENPAEMLTSKRFEALMKAFRGNWDFVILDLPPVNAVIDAVSVVGQTDGMLVVIRENHCPKFVLNECVEQLRYAKANILGFVMNGCLEETGKRYHYSQRYYKYYK